MRRRFGFALLALFFVLGAAPFALAQAPTQVMPAVPTISPAELHALIARHAFFALVDVREPAEFAAGHIPGAVSLPLSGLSATYHQIPKGLRLVVYCRTGHRSAKAVEFLRANGYELAVSLAGGYTAYTAP
jgi:rhodanese-related sulfurtransferase